MHGPLIVFRADGGKAVGAGHVMRSLALASVFRSYGWLVGFAAVEETFASVVALNDLPLERLVLGSDPDEEARKMRDRWPDGADILVVDHYERDAMLEQACRGWARRIVVIDDLADRQHDADVLVDVANSETVYRRLVPESCLLLTGAAYAIVSETFRSAREKALARRDEGAVARILVSFGQIDAPNATLRVLAALRTTDFTGDIDVVLGHAAPHLEAVRAGAGPRTHVHVDAGSMAELMTQADLAIGAGGVTALERCCLGLPSVVVTIADNQRGIVAMLKGAEAAVDAGSLDSGMEARLKEALPILLDAAPRRALMARAAANLVDGMGPTRIMLAAAGTILAKDGSPVRLRPATLADEAWLLEMQSCPDTRRYFQNPDIPTPEEHHLWMQRTLNNPARLLALVECNGVVTGMIRLDRLSGEHSLPHYQVSIAVVPGRKRGGIGAAALSLARRLVPSAILDATIMPQNSASILLFSRSGFVFHSNHIYRSSPQ